MIRKLLLKEAYLIPIFICLFFIPLIYFPFFINSFSQAKELIFKFILLITFFLLALNIIIKQQFKLKYLLKNKLFILLIAASILILLSTLFSPTPVVALFGTYSRGFGMITMLFLLIFVIYCANVLNKLAIKKALKIFAITGSIIALYAILQKIGFDPLFNNYDTDIFVGRVFGFIGNPAYLGQLMVLILIISGYFFINTKENKYKVFFALSNVAALAALWFSGTRAAMLTVILSIVLTLIRYRKKIRFFKIFIISGIVATIAVTGFIVQQNSFSISDIALRSMNSRFVTWNGALGLIQERPVLGYGAETFYIYSPEIITKEFLTLEEDISLSIDRVHNEFLESLFSYGVFVGLIYIGFIILILKLFFTSKEPLLVLLSLLIVANVIQNQFAFSDISIAVFISFCMGGIMALTEKKTIIFKFSFNKHLQLILGSVALLILVFSMIGIIYKPFMSQLSYAKSLSYYSTNQQMAIAEHEKALDYTPYYSKLWYELMFIDSTSLEKSLYYLDKIEGESGNVLAWKGNYYSDSDPAKSAEYFIKALEKNSHYPNWIRAFADMLYKNGDYESALYLYKQYLKSVPDFWKWAAVIEQKTPEEQKSYRIFFKNVPDFWVTVERVNVLELLMKE